MKLDISINKIPHNGALELSAIIAGYRESRVYYGYSKREALRAFRATFSKGSK